MNSLPFSKENMEDNEVDGLQWLPINKCGSLQWAFDHDELIGKIIKKYSHLINKENYLSLSERGKIMRVIDILENDGDTDYALDILRSMV